MTAGSRWQPQIVAHRGNTTGPDGAFPENSAGAFAEARRLGFPCECDVHLTADGEVVVIHDETLDRTTLATGAVANFTAEQLQKTHLRMAGGHVATVPVLRDVADAVALVEIKPPDSPQLVKRVIEIMAGRSWLLQSFDERNLLHAQAIDPTIPLAFLVEDDQGIDIAIKGRWPTHLDHRLLDDRVAGLLKDAGLRIGAWTVNDEPSLRHITRHRPEVVITDSPLMVQRCLDAQNS